MPVNQPRPETAAHARLYLKEEELDRAVDLVFLATREFWKSAESALDALELGPAHYRALAAIRRHEGLTVSALQDALDVRKQSLARVLAELDQAGLIARAPGAADKRQRLLSLTDAGRDAERAASAALRERLGRVFRLAGADAVAGARLVLSMLAEETAP